MSPVTIVCLSPVADKKGPMSPVAKYPSEALHIYKFLKGSLGTCVCGPMHLLSGRRHPLWGLSPLPVVARVFHSHIVCGSNVYVYMSLVAIVLMKL
jgi:hypothetical protein